MDLIDDRSRYGKPPEPQTSVPPRRADIHMLTQMLHRLGLSSYDAARAAAAGSANEVFGIAAAAGLPRGEEVARQVRNVVQRIVGDRVRVDVLVVARDGTIAGVSGAA